MKKIGLVVGVIFVFVAMPLHAQPDSCGAYWFSLSATDPTPVTEYDSTWGDVFTLHAWLLVDAPNWQNGVIGGFTFPIVYDTNYIDVEKCLEGMGDTMTVDETTLGNYMFHGIRFPCDTIESSPPGQAMWYAAVCFSGCMPTDSTPQHIGSITFKLKEIPTTLQESLVTLIDTGMYPPSNYATMGDFGGTATVWPEWTPFMLNPASSVAERTHTTSTSFLKIPGPNPFSNKTSISFGLARKGEVNIAIYDVTGRLVRTLVNGVKESGNYTVEWDGRDNSGRSLASGAYFVRMKTKDFNSIKRVLVLR